ncbi:unnamed protein product [Peronospora destructor]|uniref:NYN domain-containing protein n=1 Tax=Peronospora destructor TaxID=86335 RepID=A0AAV0TXE8_9STRA|nr:unnamed protein product [Peronospora destructor]
MDNRRMEAVQVLSSVSSTSSTESSPTATETVRSNRTALIIDGSYAMIGARSLGGKIDYVKLRAALEEQALTQFGDCWFFDQNPYAQRLNPALTVEYNRLKFAPPDGPQFQVSLFPMKKYNCHCRRCGNCFTQNVQKGVDNGIATKILSLAYENICDRFVLFAGDGDFYSSLSHVRNVLRKDIWVMGYRGTVSGDLQQLASRVIWMDDLWSQVKSIRHLNYHEQGGKDEGRKHEGCRDEVGWFEDHKGEDFQLNNDSILPLDDVQDVGNSRQVVIAPRCNQRDRGRGRDWRSSGIDRGKNGRRCSWSRSRVRLRGDQHSSEVTATHAVPDADATTTRFQSGAAMKKHNPKVGGKRECEWVGKIGQRRKRTDTDKSEQKRSKRGGRWGKEAGDFPIFTMSDISSDEDTGKPLLPVPLGSATVAPVTIAQGRDFSGGG